MNATVYSLVVLSFCCLPLARSQSTLDQDTELGILKHYEGTWNCVFTIEPTSEGESPKRFTGVVKGKWVVGNRFLEQTGQYQLSENSPPLVIKTMMTFDNAKSRYQYDYFTSSGEVHRSFGKWNPETKTMTSTREDDRGNKTTIVAEFGTPDVEHWSIEIKDPEGKLSARLVGTNTRKRAE